MSTVFTSSLSFLYRSPTSSAEIIRMAVYVLQASICFFLFLFFWKEISHRTLIYETDSETLLT